VGITLALMDEMLCRFEEWGRGREARAVLYEERNLLSDRQRASLIVEISRIRPIINRLKDDLRLSPQVCTAADDIRSRSAVLRENLMELDCGQLRGYGDVHPRLERLLKNKVPLILEGLDRILSAITPARGTPA
jgi:hypothetical protein